MKQTAISSLPLIFIIFLASCQSAPDAKTSIHKAGKTEKIRIAIMDLKADDVSKATARKASELIRTEMIALKGFVIIERSQMDKILKEQGFQQTGCTDQSCAVKVGRLLSARKIFVGTVMKLGNKFIITGRIVDAESGAVDFSGKASSQSLQDIDTACGLLIRDINTRTGRDEGRRETKDSQGKSEALKYADLSKADLRKMHFVKDNLKYANLKGANLEGVNLREANLKYANLQNTNLRNTDLTDADLKYANLKGADLRGANIEDAEMKYTKLTKAVINSRWRRYIMKNCMNYKNVQWAD